MRIRNALLVLAGTFCLLTGAVAQNVIEDQGVSMSMQELEVLVKHWPPNMQQAAAGDAGHRIELLSMALANKKMDKPSAEGRRVSRHEAIDRAFHWVMALAIFALMITGVASTTLKERALAAGFCGILLKPLNPRELITQVSAQIALHG